MEPADLVAAAEKALGVSGDTALAVALGFTDHHAPSRIARWRKGDAKPNYDATLTLLRAAGMLSLSAGRPRAAEKETDGLLGELEAEVAGVFARLREHLQNRERR